MFPGFWDGLGCFEETEEKRSFWQHLTIDCFTHEVNGRFIIFPSFSVSYKTIGRQFERDGSVTFLERSPLQVLSWSLVGGRVSTLPLSFDYNNFLLGSLGPIKSLVDADRCCSFCYSLYLQRHTSHLWIWLESAHQDIPLHSSKGFHWTLLKFRSLL